MRRSLARISSLVLVAAAAGCGDDPLSLEPFPATEEEVRARFPAGDMVDTVHSQHDFVWRGKRYFPFIGDEGDLVGSGPTVVIGPKREDGSRTTYGEGRWEYRYGGHDDNGPRLAIGHKSLNEPIGLWRFWHRNGKVRAEGWFGHGDMDGVWRIYNDDGSLDAGRSGVYRKGERVADLPPEDE